MTLDDLERRNSPINFTEFGSFRCGLLKVVPRSVTLNDLERRSGRYLALYFTEFGKPVIRHITASICSGISEQV